MNATEPYQAHSDSDRGLREKAIDLYILGEKPSVMARQLGRSRTWFYQVLERCKTGGRAALASRSRAPKRVHIQEQFQRELPDLWKVESQ